MSRPPPEDDRVQLTLRLPGALHRLLTEKTPQAGSLNAEIVRRLEQSIADEGLDDLEAVIGDHEKRLDKLEGVVYDMMAALRRLDGRPR